MIFEILLMLVPTAGAVTLPEPEIDRIELVSELEDYALELDPKCVAYVPEVMKYDWDPMVALEVIHKESGCNQYALNPEPHKNRDGTVICYGSAGPMQVSCHDGLIYDIAKNIAAGHSKYAKSGWRPWGVCTSGKVDCGI